MDEFQITITVFFEEPFWIGVFEKIEHGKLSASKVTFGAEPKDYEVYAFILKHYDDLQFSPAVATVVKEAMKKPKRMQRDIKKSLEKNGIGTKSQQALKLQQEQSKQEHKVRTREQKREEAERQFVMKQQQKKEKHSGR